MKTAFRLLATGSLTQCLLLAVVCACATVTYGQGGGRNLATRGTDTTERTLSGLEADSRRGKRDAQSIMAEVNEDFTRLRALNDDIKVAASATSPLDYKAISDNAMEIKKRGTRLRVNLAALPSGEKQEKEKMSVPTDELQMKSLLTSLNAVMTSFLGNPVFSDMGTLDNQLASQARRDLDSFISMSNVVRSGAEKLSKRH